MKAQVNSGTNEHQCTIGWKPVVTQLWMNPN
jgi:hypothetical protein